MSKPVMGIRPTQETNLQADIRYSSRHVDRSGASHPLPKEQATFAAALAKEVAKQQKGRK